VLIFLKFPQLFSLGIKHTWRESPDKAIAPVVEHLHWYTPLPSHVIIRLIWKTVSQLSSTGKAPTTGNRLCQSH